MNRAPAEKGMLVCPLVFDFDDHIDFNGDVERECCDAAGCARVDSFVAKDFDKQVRAAIDHGGMPIEVWLRVDEAIDSDNFLNLVE